MVWTKTAMAGDLLKRMGGAFGAAAMAFVYPPTCMHCGVFVRQPGALCGQCWQTLHFIEQPLCPVLGTPFGHAVEQGTVSLAAIAEPPAFVRARAVTLYDDVARQLVSRLKYGDRADLALPMARWMHRAGAELLAVSELIVPVPLHRRRVISRRYNQAAELARTLSRLSGVAYAAGALVRRRATLQQVGLGRSARTANVRGAFAVLPERRHVVAGRRILLIDDVYTTGATVNAAARALYRAGAGEVCVLTFARVADTGEAG